MEITWTSGSATSRVGPLSAGELRALESILVPCALHPLPHLPPIMRSSMDTYCHLKCEELLLGFQRAIVKYRGIPGVLKSKLSGKNGMWPITLISTSISPSVL